MKIKQIDYADKQVQFPSLVFIALGLGDDGVLWNGCSVDSAEGAVADLRTAAETGNGELIVPGTIRVFEITQDE